jgi:hypothetical protein
MRSKLIQANIVDLGLFGRLSCISAKSVSTYIMCLVTVAQVPCMYVCITAAILLHSFTLAVKT